MNLLTVSIALSVGASMFYYWATAKNRWLKTAYLTCLSNAALLIWVNWTLAGRDRVPEISFSGVEWTSDTSATNLFTALCIWMFVSGVRGLLRLRELRRRSLAG